MTVSMKDSGVEWLGEVPAHWDIVPPTALFTESKERARDDDQILSATQKYGVIPLAEFEALEQRQVTKASANLEMRKHVEIGDFVISMRSMDGGLERAHAVGSVRSSYSVLKAGPDVDGRFFGLLLKSSLYIQALRLTSSFIRDGQDLNFSHVRKVKLPKLGRKEQTAIADYICRATTRIDALVAKKTRFIELLREKRLALISHAVTKGMDASAPMKDSGVEWLREVPAEWKVVALKRLGRLKGGSGFPPSLQGRSDNEIPFFKVGDLAKSPDGQHLFETGNTITPDEAKDLGAEIFPVGALTWAKIGAALSLNRRRIITKPSCLDNNMTGFVPDATVASTKFSFYLMSAVDFTVHARPGAVPSFSEGDQGELLVSLPPLSSQQDIVTHLDRATTRIDALIAKTERSIELLREHRTALITAAVTGKIDLRNAA